MTSANKDVEGESEFKDSVLDYARRVALAASRGEPEPPAPCPKSEVVGALVSLRCGGEARGFLGSLEPRPVFEAVALAARLAAVGDLRYEPSALSEDVEVSVWLTGPTREIEGPEDIQPNEGVVVKVGFNRAIHIPGVPGIGEGPEAILASACVAADLHREAWKRPAAERLAFSVEALGTLGRHRT